MDEKATRKTIPGLVGLRRPFSNTSGTLRGIVDPDSSVISQAILLGEMAEDQAQILQADSQHGISYLVMSYQMPIAWEVEGVFRIIEQSLTQTSERHRELLYLV